MNQAPAGFLDPLDPLYRQLKSVHTGQRLFLLPVFNGIVIRCAEPHFL
jgi:hypothetical protein